MDSRRINLNERPYFIVPDRDGARPFPRRVDGLGQPSLQPLKSFFLHWDTKAVRDIIEF
jgi:hypothetical protein